MKIDEILQASILVKYFGSSSLKCPDNCVY